MLKNSINTIRRCDLILSRTRRAFSGAVDRDLQASYSGVMPRLRVLQGLLSEDGRGGLLKLNKSGLVPPEDYLHLLILYTDLQNPLLKKYDFEPESFLEGSKEAFTQVHKAIASSDFYNYVNGFQQQSKSDKLLQLALHPKLYKFSKLANKELYENNIQTFMTSATVLSMAMLRVRTKVVEETVFDKTIADVIVEKDRSSSGGGTPAATTGDGERKQSSKVVVESTFKSSEPGAAPPAPEVSKKSDGEEVSNNSSSPAAAATGTPPATVARTQSVDAADSASVGTTAATVENVPTVKLDECGDGSSSSTAATTSSGVGEDGGKDDRKEEKKTKFEEVEELSSPSLVVKYPAGSVVATVDMVFEAQEEYESSLPDGARTTSLRKTFSRWTFRSCISGQQELDWQVVAFDGYGAP